MSHKKVNCLSVFHNSAHNPHFNKTGVQFLQTFTRGKTGCQSRLTTKWSVHTHEFTGSNVHLLLLNSIEATMEHFLHFMNQLDPGDTRPTSLLECMTEARNGGNLAALMHKFTGRD